MADLTKAEALVIARKLLGPKAGVKTEPCALFPPRDGKVPGCMGSDHPRDCPGGQPRCIVYVDEGVHGGVAVHAERGSGSTWETALLSATWRLHRDRCARCNPSKHRFCNQGQPLWDALASLTGGKLSAAGLKAEAAKRKGCVRLSYAKKSGLLVGLYKAAEAGIENDPETPWATVCEEHGGVVCHATRKIAEAWMATPETWCPTCQEKRGGPKAYPHGPAPDGASEPRDEES